MMGDCWAWVYGDVLKRIFDILFTLPAVLHLLPVFVIMRCHLCLRENVLYVAEKVR